ncbi:hypothetical protein ABEW34_21640 [Paenibacillus algorifonticola]|uniref:hypothetical protein n=1 Tax=Paenibacillus algorifonticola TaxID=684063 RepID=UPI003D2E2D87
MGNQQVHYDARQIISKGRVASRSLDRLALFMKSIIGLLLTVVYFLYFIFQPSVEQTVQHRDQMLQRKAFETAHLVALEGRMTAEIREKTLASLEKMNFDRSKVELLGPSSTVERGALIEISLRYPQGRTQIFDLFEANEPRDYYYPVSIMSEHIETS